jgi:hypothetical protein
MNSESRTLENVEKMIRAQIELWKHENQLREEAKAAGPRPYLTLSRERGTGAREIAALLQSRLNWAVLDKELADLVAHETKLERQLLETVDERYHSQLESYLNALLMGRFPHAVDYAKSLGRVLHIYLRHDPAIIIGRGANMLLRDLGRQGLHVRLVAPLEWRIRHLQESQELSKSAAREEILHVDAERALFVKGAYGRDVADPTLYDLTLNCEGLGREEIVQVILAALPSGQS